ncbi:ataxin-2-like protein isoform X3 [Plutella xylostella]|uniref:ataxin-2-like protein isoform X3 n=1 Tax=Plutella xylostella TaxID=51655 RepID=UPI0020326783|nr:ataxin-2-like protein isoform X3 [Plutella xylostella]
MNNKRKNRQGPPRSPRGRVVAEGVYNNAHFMHAATRHVGEMVQVLTQSGSLWEGVFRTFSSQFEVVLEVAHRVDQEGVVAVDSVVEKLIFKPQDVVSIRAKDSDLEYATHDVFQTDSAISAGKFNGNGRSGEERHLEPWDGCLGDCGDAPALNGDARLDSLELDHRANGWDANDMFRKNEEVYGVHSTYDHSLTGYTLPLQRKDTQDYREAEAKAEEIAAEIESASTYKARIELENGDEEERYAAVVRPSAPADTGKYVIPNKRKNMQGAGGLVKPTVNNNSPNASNAPAKSYASPHPRKEDKEQRPPRHHLTPPSERRQDETANRSANPPSGGTAGKSYAAQAGGYHAPPPFPHQGQPAPPPTVIQPKVNGEPRPPAHARQFPPQPHHQSPAPPQEAHPRPPRHHAPPEPRRQDEVQELRKFGQEFKLVSSPGVAPPPAPAPVLQQPPTPTTPEVSAEAPPEPRGKRQDIPLHKPPPAPKPEEPAAVRSPLPASPPVAVSPPVERVAVTLKKSTLNPNAKEFNPCAKPFTPRSPSTPNQSRPHTPGTPVGALGGVGVVGAGVSYMPAPHPPPPHMVAAVPAYAMVAAAAAAAQQQPTYIPHPHPLAYGAMGGGGGVGGGAGQHAQHAMPQQQQRNFRKVGVGAGVGVAAATGQPLLAPAPMQQFVPYPHPAPPQPQPMYQHMVRMYHGGGMGGMGGMVGGEGVYPPPASPAASPALYPPPPPSPAHTPHHHYQQPPFQVLCPLMGPGGGGGHHHHHHHVTYLNHAPPTASPPHPPPQHLQYMSPWRSDGSRSK